MKKFVHVFFSILFVAFLFAVIGCSSDSMDAKITSFPSGCDNYDLSNKTFGFTDQVMYRLTTVTGTGAEPNLISRTYEPVATATVTLAFGAATNNSGTLTYTETAVFLAAMDGDYTTPPAGTVYTYPAAGTAANFNIGAPSAAVAYTDFGGQTIYTRTVTGTYVYWVDPTTSSEDNDKTLFFEIRWDTDDETDNDPDYTSASWDLLATSTHNTYTSTEDEYDDLGYTKVSSAGPQQIVFTDATTTIITTPVYTQQ